MAACLLRLRDLTYDTGETVRKWCLINHFRSPPSVGPPVPV